MVVGWGGIGWGGVPAVDDCQLVGEWWWGVGGLGGGVTGGGTSFFVVTALYSTFCSQPVLNLKTKLSVNSVFIVSSLSLSESISSGGTGSQQAPFMIYLCIKLTIIPAVIGTNDSNIWW